jgi:hypothetical protein
LSPSDLKAVKEPSWVRPEVGAPTLMLFSVVDDRSGVAYQEYHCVYGEDVEAALRFLFNAMAPKPVDDFPFHGIPSMIYLDNGPIAKSQVFQQVMRYLDVDVRPHMPQGKDGRRVTARSKGKVERPFRTVKEMHETLYHFHEPKDEAEANAWLMHFLARYNGMQHRSEPHSRLDDWLQHLPPSGVRAICSWERFCTFAREPERRKVGIDARVSVAGVHYEVDPDLAGETVVLWWGLFDNELYVEHGERRFGPYAPIGGPIPLHRYRAFKKTLTQRRAERIEALAVQLALPRAALAGHPRLKNGLERPAMEEIGSRATIFELEGIRQEKPRYIGWLIKQCAAPKTEIHSILTEDALARLAERLTTPLQIERHLSRALEEGYKVGQKPVGAELIDTVIAKDIDDLEPRLTRQGYHMKALAELLSAKPAEIRLFLRGQLATGRTQELHSGLLAAGIPL